MGTGQGVLDAVTVLETMAKTGTFIVLDPIPSTVPVTQDTGIDVIFDHIGRVLGCWWATGDERWAA